jgi:hypothetical protein
VRHVTCPFKTVKAGSAVTRSKNILDLPYTIREKILKLVLSGNSPVHISYSRLKQADIIYPRGYGYLSKCSLSLEKDSTNFFLSCRQMHDEAARLSCTVRHHSHLSTRPASPNKMCLAKSVFSTLLTSDISLSACQSH